MIKLRRRTVLTAIVAAGAGGAVAAAVTRQRAAAPRPTRAEAQTAEVALADLVDSEDFSGELGFGEAVPLRYIKPEASPAEPGEAGQPGETGGASNMQGRRLITWLAPVGSTVARGEPLFRVDDKPVALLFGPLPMFRPLAVGVKGRDVKQLEENLRAMNLGSLTADESFTAATATAVKRWQRLLGLEDTGAIDPGQVVYTPGAVRIAAHTLRVGDPADGEILQYTGTTRSVRIELPVKQQRVAVPGTAVTVVLPDGGTVDGVVDRAGAPSNSQSGEPKIEVMVALADQTAAANQRGQATVRFVIQERKNVLTVPVLALVALAEGGYGVQLVDGGGSRYVAVETGLFANGRVEIKPGTLTPGQGIVIPR